MARIEKLTPAQSAREAEFAERWTKIGLETAPADRPRAEAAIVEMYRIAGLSAPKIVWCGSPLSQGLTRAIILDKKWMKDIGDSVGASVGASVWDSVWASVYGQHDASWLAFYRFFHDELKLTEQTQRLDGLWEFSQAGGWALPFRDICFIAERHTTLRRDERGRLHSDDGPAVQYPDGWAIYAVHGVRVPAWLMEAPDRLTPEAIQAEANTEVQRVMIERYGWDRYVADVGGQIIDHDEKYGTLLKTPGGLVLKVINRSPEPDGSFRQYILPVSDRCEPLPDPNDPRGELGDPQALTALNAVASTFGMRGKEYAAVLGAES